MDAPRLLLVAECGINHNGSLDLAKHMIFEAKQSGFDFVKFQIRDVESCYTREFLDSPRDSPWGKTQRAQKNGIELSRPDYRAIDAYCSDLGIFWSASCWDLNSQAFLRSFKSVIWNKVASAMLGNRPLLREIADEGKFTFISSGMSTLEELDEAVNLFRRANCPFELLHCNSTYPMPDESANLLNIPLLSLRYGCLTGWSGHETSLIKVCVAAVALGAASLERHVTLDRSMYGSDQAASIETRHLRDFVDSVRAVPLILGDGVKRVTESEWPVRKKLRVEA